MVDVSGTPHPLCHGVFLSYQLSVALSIVQVKAQLGFLNVETQAERLDRLKQNMLNTSMGSQNEGQTIYPVSMQPEVRILLCHPDLVWHRTCCPSR